MNGAATDTAPLRCYRCGEDLAELTLPLSRRDLCPGCRVDLHVCLMCTQFDPRLPGQCAEEGAEDVHEKARANFCDYFTPNPSAFAPGRMTAQQRAEAALDDLFGGGSPDAAPSQTGDEDDPLSDAEALFKR